MKAAGNDETVAVRAQMAKTPVNDMFAKGGRIREDGRMVHDMYLVQVKTPAESTGEWGPVQDRQHHSGRAGLPADRRDPVHQAGRQGVTD